jgi:uncharacterized membrane protein YphA (DoxX/SURF4 family)
MMGLFVLACRLVVGGVFLYASIDKLLHPAAFARAIHNYHLVPMALLHPWAHYLPVLEVVIGLALVLGVWRRGAALVAALLTVVFIAAIASALVRGLDINCGCFHAEGGHGVGLDLLVRDVGLLALCLPPLLARRGGPGLRT